MSDAFGKLNARVLAALACSNPAPGSAEFERMAAEVTPIDRVRKGFSHQRTHLTADQSHMPHAGRNESPDKPRG
jgi:hypothetical protein